MRMFVVSSGAVFGAIIGRTISALLVDLPLGLILPGFGIPVWAVNWVRVLFLSIPVYYGAKRGANFFLRDGMDFKENRKTAAFFAAFSIFLSAILSSGFYLSTIPDQMNWNYAIANAILPTVSAYLGVIIGMIKKRS